MNKCGKIACVILTVFIFQIILNLGYYWNIMPKKTPAWLIVLTFLAGTVFLLTGLNRLDSRKNNQKNIIILENDIFLIKMSALGIGLMFAGYGALGVYEIFNTPASMPEKSLFSIVEIGIGLFFMVLPFSRKGKKVFHHFLEPIENDEKRQGIYSPPNIR